MKRDEFNVEKITNVDENPVFEFGITQDAEFTSFSDNKNPVRDEVNDNPTDNSTKKPVKNEQRRRETKKEESPKDSSPSQGADVSSSAPATTAASTAGATATAATAAGASLVSVAALSTLVGVNVFFNAKCQMNKVEPDTHSIVYELDLTDINDDECVIKLEYKSYSDIQELKEGLNSGEFVDLTPSTEYHVSVVDVTYNNYILFEDNVSTKEEIIPPVSTYTVTFDSNGGSSIETQEILAGETATKPDNPVKEYYTFGGWFLDSDLTEEYDFATPVTSDITLYARWTVTKYTITFDANGGEGSIEPITVAAGSTYNLPTTWDITPPDGRIFDPNWWLVNGENKNKATPITVTSDLIVANDWDYAAMIYFDANNGQGTMEPTRTTGEFTFPKCDFIAPEGMAFDHWTYSTSSGPTQLEFQPGEVTMFQPSSDGDIRSYTIYPVWIDVYEYYTVTFDCDGGSSIEVQEILDGETANRPDDPIKEYYTFCGWFIDSDLTEEYDFAIPVTSDITIYAKWSAIMYNITFEANGGEGSIEPITVAAGSTYNLPTTWDITPPDGRIFSPYWWLVNGERKNRAIPITVTSDLVVANDWDYAAMIYFDANDGQGTMEPTRTTGEFEFPECDFIAPEGMKFDYWTYSTSSGPTDLDYQPGSSTFFEPSNEKEIKEYTIYPMWTDLYTYHTVTFNTDDGSEVEPQRVIEGELADKPVDPVKEHYHFIQWCSDSSLETPFDFETTPITEDITLYAQWSTTQYFTVSFNTDGGSEIEAQEVAMGGFAHQPEDPVKEGYNFVNWYLDSAFTLPFDFEDVTIASDTTIYAKFEEIPEPSRLRFHVNYLEGGMGQGNYTLYYSYSYNDETYPYVYTYIRFDINGEEVIDNIYINQAGGVKTDDYVELSEQVSERLEVSYDAVTYHIVGVGSSDTELATGAFETRYSINGQIHNIRMGGVDMEVNNAEIPVVYIDGHHYLPVSFDGMNDYHHNIHGTNFRFEYTINGITYYSQFTYSGGTTYVQIDDVPEISDKIEVSDLKFYDEYNALLIPQNGDGVAGDSAYGPDYFVMADFGRVFGFEIGDSILFQDTPSFRIVAMRGASGNTYADLGIDNAKLIFTFETGYLQDPIIFEFAIDLNNSETSITDYIYFTIDDYVTFLNCLYSYQVDIELSYGDYSIIEYNAYNFQENS